MRACNNESDHTQTSRATSAGHHVTDVLQTRALQLGMARLYITSVTSAVHIGKRYQQFNGETSQFVHM